MRLNDFFIYSLVVLTTMGCGGENGEGEGNAENLPQAPLSLPAVTGQAEACPEPGSMPAEYTAIESFEDWTSGAHIVVVGTVAELNLATIPFREPAATPTSVSWDGSDCSGQILPAVDVTLENVESLYGPTVNEITFRVGRKLMGEWNSYPLSDGAGGHWLVNGDDPTQGIAPGMEIGVRLYESELVPDVLSPAMTWLFEVDNDGLITFQEHEAGYSCAGDVGYFMRNDDAVRNGISVGELETGLSDAQAQWLAGQTVEPIDSTRPYIREQWSVGDGEHITIIGAGYCDE